MTGTGNTFELSFDVYRDLHVDANIFYRWFVRFSNGGCASRWFESPYPYLGNKKDWFRFVGDFSTHVQPGATQLQVSIGILDFCEYSAFCFGEYCRSHAPLIDNVEVRRIDSNGPAWSVRDIDLFQDNFAGDGTTTGTVRADAAIDLLPGGNPNVRLGDSVVVHVGNPEGRIAADIYGGNGPAIYTYIQVRPPGQPGKSGEALTSDASRWPVVDSITYAGERWYCIRMDSALTGGSEPDTAFCVDLNDNLFTPGDTIFYIFGAIANQPAVEASYYSRFTGTTDDMPYALSNPMEFTCLPTLDANLYYPASGGLTLPVLYIDGADGRGVQPYFDAAFAALGMTAAVDRFDILYLPPGASVTSVVGQLIPAYRKIVWSTGDEISPGIGEGSGKSGGAAMLKEFLDNLPGIGGVYLTGDNIAQRWVLPSAAGAALRDAYIQHSLFDDDHVDAGLGVSPQVYGVGGGIFDHATEDHLVAYGGCPTINDFDVITPAGAATAEMLYGGSASHPAIIAQRTNNLVSNPGPVSVGAVLSGFSFHEVQDAYTHNQPTEPAHHLNDILQWLAFDITSDASATPRRNALAQNYPTPFNPTTTIEFSLRESTHVTLRIYNVSGQLVRTLVDDKRAPGIQHRVQWGGRNDSGQEVASGIYFYRLSARGFTKTKKMLLLK
jgi:hypothetical protein